MNSHFHVINLKRRTDRRNTFSKWNSNLIGFSFEFLEAVDRRSLDLDDVRADGLLSHDANFPVGNLACALSHRRMLLRCLKSGEPLLVCEDDAVFRSDFAEEWNKLLAQLKSDWDIVLFGYNFDSAIATDVIPGVTSLLGSFHCVPLDALALDRFRSHDQPVILRRLYNAFGLPAYAISPTGAEKILNHCFPIQEREVLIPALRRTVRAATFDSLLNGLYPQLRAWTVFPPLVVTPNDKRQSDTVN